MQSFRDAFLSRRFLRRWPWAALGALSLSAALLFVVGSWQGCSIYGPELLLSAPDGGPEASSDSGSEATGASHCAHARWPDRPAAADASASPEAATPFPFSAVAAMQAIDVGYGFGTGDAGLAPVPDGGLAPYGWDLDNVCTCQGSPPGPPSCTQMSGTLENCDDDAGRDHIALELFRVLGTTAETESQTANQAMHAGQYGLLVQITGYNGMPNDDTVTVALYASNGVGTPDGGTPNPNHDGNDKWTVDPGYLTGGKSLLGMDCDGNPSCVPIFTDSDAYVTGGRVVASLVTVPLTFGSRANFGGALMQLNDVKLVGTLIQTPLKGGDLGWAIQNGSVSGRWETSQLLGNLSTIPDPNEPDGSYFCGDDPYYKVFKTGICDLQDIAANQSNDNVVGASCNALSMAFGFNAEPARLGQVYGVSPAPSGCVDDAGTTWHDTCP